MKIEKLFLQNFRNYSSKLFEFERGINVLMGNNAVGKTNVLEAIYLMATGDSFRAMKIDEMVGWESEVAHVGIKAHRHKKNEILRRQATNSRLTSLDDSTDLESLSVESNTEEVELKVVLTRGVVGGEKARKRQFLVNGVSRQKQAFVGNMVAVAFLPSDLSLIGGSPSRRRGYLDKVLSQVDREYLRSLLSYEKALKQRNKLLDSIREGQVDKSALLFWDQLLIKEGNVLTDKRQALIDFVNDSSDELRIVYDYSAISEKRLSQYEREEIFAGYTLVGPHKDDFSVESVVGRNRDLAIYGSRGEQRMGVLWLKMQELAFVENMIGERPILLLDDIFSELDEEHEEKVWKLSCMQQTLITTTEVDGMKDKKVKIIELE